MADVQKSRGHVQVAHDLYRAINMAPFSDVQRRVVHALIGLTYAWNHRTVAIGVASLARFAGVDPHGRASGGFRTALAELIKANVIRHLRMGDKKRPPVFALQKDYEAWHPPFRVTADEIALLWGRRPESDDTLLDLERGESQPSDVASHEATATDSPSIEVAPPEASTAEIVAPHEATSTDLVASAKTTSGLSGGHNPSVSDETVRLCSAGKTVKDSSTVVEKDHIRTTSNNVVAADDDERTSEYARGLTTAANIAIRERWGEQINVLVPSGAIETARTLRASNVDLDFARTTIADVCTHSKLSRPPRSVGYFAEAILAAQEAATERQAIDQATTDQRTGTRGGTPARLGLVVTHQSAQDAHDLEQRYDVARRAAARAWSEDPANEATYAAIIAAARARYADLPDNSWRARAITGEIVKGCAERAGFLTVEAWLESQRDWLAQQHAEHERNGDEHQCATSPPTTADAANEFALKA